MDELNPTTSRLTRNSSLSSSQSEFETLCSLDVLGLVDKQQATSEGQFHDDFCVHLKQNKDGSYITRLPWKLDHPVLHENLDLAKARLRTTRKRLGRIGKLEEYHQIMQEQLEKVPTCSCEAKWRECTLPVYTTSTRS